MPINTGTETATIRIDSDRRGHGGFRRRLARPGAGDDARAGGRRASRRAASRTSASCRATAPRCRAAPAPMRAAATVLAGGAATLAAASLAREGARRRLASARSRARRHRGRRTGAIAVAGTDRSVTFRERGARGLFRDGTPAARRRARSSTRPRPTIRCSAPPRSATHIADGRDRSARPIRCGSTASSSRRTAAASSIR